MNTAPEYLSHLPKAPVERLVEEGARRLQLGLSTVLLRSFDGAVPAADTTGNVCSRDRPDRLMLVSNMAASDVFQQAAVRALAAEMPDTLGADWSLLREPASTSPVTIPQSDTALRSFATLLAYTAALALGAIVGMAVPYIGQVVVRLFDAFMNAYAWLSPIVIFSVIAPAVHHILGSRQGHRQGWMTIKGFLWLKLAACLMGVVATVVLLDLPLLPTALDIRAASWLEPLKEASWSLVVNPLYWAIYLAIVAGFLARKWLWLRNGLENGARGIERLGEWIEPLVPAFLFATGVYVVSLPDVVAAETSNIIVGHFEIFGLSLDLDASNVTGMMGLYVFGAVLVAIVCWVWHLILLVATVFIEPRFRVRDYFIRYWRTVYPLLWATSSERLTQPVSLYRAKHVAPWLPAPLRRLVIGLGTTMNINGTIICVFVLAGVVGRALGLDIGLINLLAAVPMVYLISLAVPGIPGELVLFAGPLIAALGLTPEQAAPFLALYLGLQLGLPDSFRTGTNSTDDLLCAVMFNALTERADSGSTGLKESRPLMDAA